MADVVLLKNIISEKGCSINYIARQIGKSAQAIYNKLDGKTEFTVSEVNVLVDVLRLTSEERDKIFYS